MDGYCTCGAKLAEGALFCHKCGKPQREDLLAAEEPLPPPPPPLPVLTPAPQFTPISFHNGAAVRTALLFGPLAILMSMLFGQFLGPASFLVWLVAAGFLAVLFYRRRTGQKLTIIGGAHLGWICGIFVFIIAAVVLAANVVANPGFLDAMRQQLQEQMRTAPNSDVQINQVIDFLRSPSGLLVSILTSFLFFTVLPAFGGALGAKLLDRD